MSIATLLYFITLILIAYSYTFEDFELEFNRNYTEEEREKHRQAFQKNYQEILDSSEDPNIKHEVSVNNFTDMTDEEKESISFINKGLFSYKPAELDKPYDTEPVVNKVRAVAYPVSLNYSAQSKVTKVKNQGTCGSCWAFTSTAIYESQLLIHGKGEYDLSEQYILECAGSGDCNGGWPYLALNFLSENGLPLESRYPYEGKVNAYDLNQICKETALINLNLQIDEIKHYNQLSSSTLRQLLYDNGPISVGISAGETGFLFYAGGVFKGCASATSEESIDHVVLLVGWTENGDWIVKNSWGKSWGSLGYGIISKDRDCGIGQFVDVLKVSVAKTNESNIEKLAIKMSDSYGDGWNSYILGLRQNNKIVAVFGEEFTSGSSQGPLYIDIPHNIETQVVVVVAGSYSNEIGFTLSQNNKTLCSRKSGQTFSNDIIFCEFCINCTVSKTVKYDVTLTDSGSDGWNGNILSFKQDGIVTPFGGQFLNGKKYGPRSFSFTKKIPVDIIVQTVGNKSLEIGFEIRDNFGNIVLKRKPGLSFQKGANLGTFCPECTNTFTIKTQLSFEEEKSIQEVSPYYNNPSKNQARPYIIAVSILSTLVVLLILIILLIWMKKPKITEEVSSPTKSRLAGKSFQVVSIMGSTATIPDENENDNSENLGKREKIEIVESAANINIEDDKL